MKRWAALASALWLTSLPASGETPAGDATRGETLFRAKCFACHSLDADRVGPRLGGVVGRPAGTVAGYSYSAALATSGLTWDAAALQAWLAGPRSFLPGARMPFALRSEQDRTDLIAYLASTAAASR